MSTEPVVQTIHAAWPRLLAGVPEPRLLAAVSGGIDSMVLLDALVRAGHPPALVASVHHGLQPQADQWIELVRQAADRHGLAFRALRIEVGARARGERGTEAAARDARYAALLDAARAAGCNVIALAHHRDDQAETVLLQMLRGAGLTGVAAMPELRAEEDLWLWRPLLALTREQIAAHAEQRGLSCADDPSNADDRFARSALRHRVLPPIERHFPAYRETLARFAQHAAEQAAFVREVAEADLAGVREAHAVLGDALRLSRWLALGARRQRAVLRAWIEALGLRAPSEARLREMQRQLAEARADRALVLVHQGVRLRRYRDWIAREEARREPLATAPQPSDEEAMFTWHGEPRIAVPAFGGAWCFEPIAKGDARPGIAQERLEGRMLTVRARRGRERLCVQAGSPSRTLKNLMQERGIPAWQRPRLPLLYAGEELVAVAGIGMDLRRTAQMGARIALRWEAEAVATIA